MLPVLLIHIASDHLYMQASDAETVYIPYQDLERNFPSLFFAYIADKNIDTLVVINGPGSFTQLRIACLTLRLYIQSFASPDLAPRCIDIPKLDIYIYMMQQWLLPDTGLVFAGQRKKLFALYAGRDLDHDITDDEMLDQTWLETYIWTWQQYRAEHMTEHTLLDTIDATYIHSPFTLVWDCLETEYMWSTYIIDIEEVWREVAYFRPVYMMEPKIG